MFTLSVRNTTNPVPTKVPSSTPIAPTAHKPVRSVELAWTDQATVNAAVTVPITAHAGRSKAPPNVSSANTTTHHNTCGAS